MFITLQMIRILFSPHVKYEFIIVHDVTSFAMYLINYASHLRFLKLNESLSATSYC